MPRFAMTMTRALLTGLVILLSAMFPPCILFAVSFSTTLPSAPRASVAWRRNDFCHRHHCTTNGSTNEDVDSDSSIPALERIETENSNKRTALSISRDEATTIHYNNTDSNSTEISTVQQPELPQTMEEFRRALVSLKEKVYATIRQIFSDLVTIVKRSATRARNWAMDDEVGQVVSSGLALVTFFALVAAFAAWNIEVLSGGKSKWSGPQNGVTMPVVKGLPTMEPPEGSIATTTTTIRFQKPKWTAPKIRTSYNNDDSSSKNSRRETTETGQEISRKQ